MEDDVTESDVNSDMDEVDDLFHNQRLLCRVVEKGNSLFASVRFEMDELKKMIFSEMNKNQSQFESLSKESEGYSSQLHSMIEELQKNFT